jgi:hypothetical protein
MCFIIILFIRFIYVIVWKKVTGSFLIKREKKPWNFLLYIGGNALIIIFWIIVYYVTTFKKLILFYTTLIWKIKLK